MTELKIGMPSHIWHFAFCPAAQANASQKSKSQILPTFFLFFILMFFYLLLPNY